MAWQFDVNNANDATAGGAHAIFDLKELLVAGGGQVVSSGATGYSYGVEDNVDRITTFTIMNVASAWFVILWEGVYWAFQRGSGTQVNWWIQISPTGFDTGGGVTTVPTASAADAVNVHGTGATGAALFTTAGTYRHHCGCDDASPGGFYLFCLVNGSGAVSGGLYFEPMATSSFPAEDTQPWVVLVAESTYFCDYQYMYGTTSRAPQGYIGSAWVPIPAGILQISSYILAPGMGAGHGVGTNPYNGSDERLPIPYGRAAGLSTNIGWKGWGLNVRWKGYNRSNGDTMSTSGVRDRIIVNNASFPWPDIAPVI